VIERSVEASDRIEVKKERKREYGTVGSAIALHVIGHEFKSHYFQKEKRASSSIEERTVDNRKAVCASHTSLKRRRKEMKKRKKDRKRRKEVDAMWEERTSRKAKVQDMRVRKRSAVERKVKPVRKAGLEKGMGLLNKGSKKKRGVGKGRRSAETKERVSKRSMRCKKARRGVKGREKREKEARERKGKLGERGGEKTKVRNRCVDTGNGRSVVRWFRKSGRKVRERARRGKLEGVYRASW
jgi:ribosomal protein S14